MFLLLPDALRLTQWFEVFPLRPDGKPLYNCDACAMSKGNSCPTPEAMAACLCINCHSYYRASNDEGRVEALWHGPDCDGEEGGVGCLIRSSKYLIGIRTGRDFLVVDFDKHGAHDGTATFDRWKAEGLLRNTWIARTGGGGLHFYYRLDDGLEIRNGQPLGTVGVDIKGQGGYVVAPPSRKEGATQGYTWLRGPETGDMAPIHPELLEAVVARPDRRAPSVEQEYSEGATLNLFHWFINTFPPTGGNRNNFLFQASCVAGECIAIGVLAEHLAKDLLKETAIDAGLRLGEIRATISSGLNRGQNNVLGAPKCP